MNMAIDRFIDESDLADNPTPRTPVILCLDVSFSMAGEKIKNLNKGIRDLYASIANDQYARMSADIAIVTFETEVRLIEDFSTIESKTPPTLQAKNGTALGHGLEMAVNHANARKDAYKMHGTDYHQPMIFLMTDGKPGDMGKVREVLPIIHALEREKKLTVFPIGIGSDLDEALMRTISVRANNMRISRSISTVAMSPSESAEQSSETSDLIVKEWNDILG
jgi:uncharacterized protein YegL